MSDWRFIPHPDAERFDAVTLETVERWKESELSGDEWRFSYIATFWSHGQKRASISAASIADLLVRAASEYSRVKIAEPPGGYYGDLENLCCQPGCGAPWVVLLHPVKAYTVRGEALVRPYGEKDVRGFCDRHRHRGDCALDDTDPNYVVVEERFPPNWAESEGDHG